jgi:hypothetical protein
MLAPILDRADRMAVPLVSAHAHVHASANALAID